MKFRFLEVKYCPQRNINFDDSFLVTIKITFPKNELYKLKFMVANYIKSMNDKWVFFAIYVLNLNHVFC